MTVRLSHPDGLLKQNDYAPVALGEGTKFLLLAGQTAATADGEVEASGLAAQVHAALENIALGVNAAGGTVGDIARLTFYIPGWTADMADALWEGTARAQETAGYARPLPPTTVIGVQGLWVPELLVEIEAVAIFS